MSRSGLDEFSAQLDRIVAKAEKAEFVDEAGRLVRAAAVSKVPKYSGYLRYNIFHDFETGHFTATSTVYTDVSYAPYVELGTGPKGAANHDGISPDVNPVYKMYPWWIHESELDTGVAEHYRWPYIDTPEGRFYKCSGQPANPFMYPAIKDNESDILKILDRGIEDALRKGTK